MGLRATVMIKKLNNLLDRLEKRVGEIKSLEIKLAKEKEESAQFYKWWQDEVAITKQLKKDVADLEGRVFDLSGSIEAAGLTVKEEPNAPAEQEVLDGPDDVDVERMQGTADHDPESLVGEEAYE